MDRFDLGVGATHSHFYGTTFTETTHQLQVHIRPACGRLAINGNDLLTRHQTRLGSQTAAFDGTNDRAHLLAAHHGQYPEEHDSQQKVGYRPGRNNGNTLPDGFTVERLVALLERHFAFALIKHFDVATQWNGGDYELSALAIMPTDQRRAEAHRKTQNLDATPARHPKVAEFMKSDQHP